MEQILKLTTICILASIFSLLIKKQQPELALLLGTCSAIFCVLSTVEIYRQIDAEIEEWKTWTMISGDYFSALFKCLGISLVSQLGIGVCKDAGQSAAASGLEFSANIATVWCLLPLIYHLFNMIEELI